MLTGGQPARQGGYGAVNTAPGAARQAATVLLTFTRSLEDDLRDPDAARGELIAGVRMITRGALAAA
jgi:hypothetical protein